MMNCAADPRRLESVESSTQTVSRSLVCCSQDIGVNGEALAESEAASRRRRFPINELNNSNDVAPAGFGAGRG